MDMHRTEPVFVRKEVRPGGDVGHTVYVSAQWGETYKDVAEGDEPALPCSCDFGLVTIDASNVADFIKSHGAHKLPAALHAFLEWVRTLDEPPPENAEKKIKGT